MINDDKPETQLRALIAAYEASNNEPSYEAIFNYASALVQTEQYKPFLHMAFELDRDDTESLVNSISGSALATFIDVAETVLGDADFDTPFYLTKPYVLALLRGERAELAAKYLGDNEDADRWRLEVLIHGWVGEYELAIQAVQHGVAISPYFHSSDLLQYSGFTQRIEGSCLQPFADPENFCEIDDSHYGFSECGVLEERGSTFYATYHGPEERIELLAALATARAQLPQQGDKPLWGQQSIIYGDYHVADNFHVTRPMLVLGNLTIDGSLTVNAALSVSGHLQASSAFVTNELTARSVQVADFIAWYSGANHIYSAERTPPMISHSWRSPLFVSDVSAAHLHGKQMFDHVFQTNMTDQPVARLKKLLREECFTYCDDRHWDLVPLESMARRGQSVFKNCDKPLHQFDRHLLPDPKVAPLKRWQIVGGFLPQDILEHADTLEELDISNTALGHIPPLVERLTSLKSLDVGDCELTSLPAFIWQMPQLEKLRLAGNSSLLTHYKQNSVQALLKFFVKEKLDTNTRLQLAGLLKAESAGKTVLSDELALLAYHSGVQELLQPCLKHWATSDTKLNAGSVLAIIGKPATKTVELVKQLATANITAVANTVDDRTSHILLAAKPTKTALKQLSSDAVARCIIVSEEQCLSALSASSSEGDTEESNAELLPKLEPGHFSRLSIAIMGTLEGLPKNQLLPQLRALDASIRKTLVREVDIMITSHTSPRDLVKAKDLGIEVWDVETTILMLEAARKANAQIVEPCMTDPALRRVRLNGREVTKLADQVVETYKIKRIQPETLAYRVEDVELHNFLGIKGVEVLRGLNILNYQQEVTETLVSNAENLKELETLACDTYHQRHLNVTHVLDALGNLRNLWLSDHMDISLEPMRHSTLEQLVLRNPEADLSALTMCSFPRLAYLEIGNEQAVSMLNDSFAQQQFPNLRHLGLYRMTNLEQVLRELVLPNISHLSLIGDGRVVVNDGAIETLIDLPISQKLKHLHISAAEIRRPEQLNHDNFPMLETLGVHGNTPFSDHVSEWVGRTNFYQGIHYDFAEGWFTSPEVRTLLEALPNINAKSIDLDFNSIMSKAQRERLLNQTVPISVRYQKT